MKKIQTYFILAMMIFASNTIAQNPAASANQTNQNGFTQADRERLIKVEVTLEQMDKRMELDEKNSDKRFEQVDKLFEQVDKRIDQILTFMGWIIGAFITITLGSILNAWWDRRSSLKPLEVRTKAVELEIEKLNNEPGYRNVIAAFRNLAKDNPKIAEILKNNHLL
jgi:hypothetical protein